MRSVRESTQEIVKLGLAPMFKRHGFKKTAFNFSRRRGSVEHHFNVQLSQWNQGSIGGFYLNVGVMFDDIKRHLGKEIPKLPKVYDCDFYIRLDAIDSQIPREIKIDGNTDAESVAAWLTKHIEISFVAPLNTVSSTQEFLSTGWIEKMPWFPAIFYYVIGNKAEARRFVELEAQTFADRGCTFKSLADAMKMVFD